jgi:hypothetical protein
MYDKKVIIIETNTFDMRKTRTQYRLEALERAKKCNRLNNKTEMRTHKKIDLSWFNKTDYQNWVNKHFLN